MDPVTKNLPEKIAPSELRIEFSSRTDGAGKKYYLAKTELPLTLDLSRASFFFWPEDGPSMTIVFSKDRK